MGDKEEKDPGHTASRMTPPSSDQLGSVQSFKDSAWLAPAKGSSLCKMVKSFPSTINLRPLRLQQKFKSVSRIAKMNTRSDYISPRL